MTLKECRRNIHLSVDELGEMLGITGRAVRTYEDGTREPGAETILKMAAVYHLPAEDILRMILAAEERYKNRKRRKP